MTTAEETGGPRMLGLSDLLARGVAGTRVLVRADLNVPMDAQRLITDDGRIRAVLPTLAKLRDAGAAVIVMAHLGRPKGAPDPAHSLAPVAARLGELLGAPVAFAGDTVGESARAAVARMSGGAVVVLENLRFNPGETSKDSAERSAFAAQLAGLADSYVDDAFGALHRRHASVYEVAGLLPHYAGDLVLAEVEVLRRLTGSPARPYVVVLGGAKVSDKLAVIEALLPKVDRLLVGGGMCYTLLRARGYEVGLSLLEPDRVGDCAALLERAGSKIVLPTDVVVATELSAGAPSGAVPVTAIPPDRMGVDLGPDSVAAFADVIHGARTVFWNGPVGVFELAPFAHGTAAVAHAITKVDGLTVVGGGDSAAAVRALGIPEAGFSHISTGGGASLEYLEGRTLPGLEALQS